MPSRSIPWTAAATPELVRGRRTRPSRRDLLQLAGVAVACGLVSSLAPPLHPPERSDDLSPYLPRLKGFEGRIHQRVRGWMMDDIHRIARSEEGGGRYIYTVEAAQLMEYFALVGDEEPYRRLRDFLVGHVVVDDPQESFTKGFVLWRCVPNTPPDASGTTEALRLARALWAGHRTFGSIDDRQLALTILDGYGRHATVDRGIWLIRNYFRFNGKSFANNTFVIDYDADFVRRVAEDLRPTDTAACQRMSQLADKSYELMRRVVAPSGLLYDLVQPELNTMYWGLDMAAFSPNDVVQINNACTTAATVARGDASVARPVLDFVLNKLAKDGKVYAHYYGRDGQRVHNQGLGAAETMSIAKLAALLKDKVAAGQFIRSGLAYWEDFSVTVQPDKAWAASEILLGLRELVTLDG